MSEHQMNTPTNCHEALELFLSLKAQVNHI